MDDLDYQVQTYGQNWAKEQIYALETSTMQHRKGLNQPLMSLGCLFASCAALSISIFKIDAEHQASKSNFVAARSEALMPQARLQHALNLQAANITPVADIARQMESEPETVDFGKTVTPDYPAVIRSAVTMALNEHTTNHNWYMAGKYGTAGASALAALWAAALVYCTRQSVRENEQEIARYRAHLDGGRAPTHT